MIGPLAIHERDGSFSKRWIEYCEERQIPFERVGCFDTDIMIRLKDKSALLWHFAHGFPQDLMFQETGNRQNYQGRYIIRHPFTGESSCNTDQYQASLRERQEREAQTLANLTGWDINEIRSKIPFSQLASENPETVPWWKSLWD